MFGRKRRRRRLEAEEFKRLRERMDIKRRLRLLEEREEGRTKVLRALLDHLKLELEVKHEATKLVFKPIEEEKKP